MLTDVVVVGGGSAGAAAAAFLAERGAKVVVLERGPLGEGGARWVNGVQERFFREAGLELPTGPELRGGKARFHLVAGWDGPRLSAAGHDVLDVDMRRLVARLQQRAREHGAELREGVSVGPLERGTLSTSSGTLTAGCFVDASGLSGANLLGQPRPPREALCAAAQQVRRVRDLPAARAFFASHGVEPGETLCFTGVAGGYSIVNVRLEGEELSILTGSLPGLGHPSGGALLDRFVEEHPWVGDALFGGARAIPLRRPYDRLATQDIAAVGDAAAQLFTVHGSGVGVGLVAARRLADALTQGRSPWEWSVAWMRQEGGLLAGFEAFRRFSASLHPEELAELITSGLFGEELVRSGLCVTLPSPGRLGLLERSGGVLRAPRLGARLGPVLARLTATLALYRAYPARPAGLPRWARLAARVCDAA